MAETFSDAEVFAAPKKEEATTFSDADVMGAADKKAASDKSEGDRLRKIAADTKDAPYGALLDMAVKPVAAVASPGGLERRDDDSLLTTARKAGTTAVIQGASDIPGVFGNTRDFGRYLAERADPAVAWGVNAIRHKFGYPESEDVTPETMRENRRRINNEDLMGAHLPTSNILPNGDDIAGRLLRHTGEYKPDDNDYLTRAGMMGIRAGVGSLGMGAAAEGAKGADVISHLMTPKVAASNAGLGAVTQAATDAWGDPLIGMAFGMAAPAAGSAASKFVRHATEPMFPGNRERLAAESILGSAQDPDAMMRWARDNPPREGLENSPKTLGQESNDTGILHKEVEQRTADRDFANEMMTKASEQNKARRAALDEIAPEGKQADVEGAFSARHKRLVDEANAKEAALQKQAQEAAAALGPNADPAIVGEKLREKLAENQAALDKQIDELYDKVDPNNDMRIIINKGTPENPSLKDVASKIIDEKRAATRHSSAVRELLGVINKAYPVWEFSELRALSQRLTAEMNQAQMRGDTVNGPILDRLKNATIGAINRAIDNQIEWQRANGVQPEESLERSLGLTDAGASAAGDASSGAGALSKEASIGSAGAGLDQGAGVGARGPNAGQAGHADSLPGLAQKAGGEHTLYFGGNALKARPEIVELRDLNISHGDDFTENPKFPQELQPRDRDVAAAQDQVNEYAGSKWAPDRYGPTKDANSGAPVVGPDGVVESGNGRSMAIRRRYSQGDTSYKEWLASQGYDVSGFDQPVLVMRRTTEWTPNERQNALDLINRDSGLRLNRMEQSTSDAKAMSPETLYKVKEGDLHKVENFDFMSSFLGKLTNSERAELIDAEGHPTPDAIRRVQAALLQKAYESRALFKKAFQSNDDNIKAVSGALTDAAGPWAKMRQAVADGRISADHDITEGLMRAVDKIMVARDAGRPVGEVIDQIDAFDPPLTREALGILMEGNKVASKAKITARLNKYAADALKNESGGLGLGEERKASEVLLGAREVGNIEGDTGPVSEAPPAPKAVAPEAAKTAPQPVEAQYIPPDKRPNMGKGQAEALASANKLYGDTEDLMRPAKPALQKQMGGTYTMDAARIPGHAVVDGNMGYTKASQFLNASKNAPEAVNAVKEMLLNKFRSAISAETGMVVPQKWNTVRSQFSGAIRAVEERQPGFEASLRDPKTTADAVLKYAAEKKAALKALDDEKAAKFLGVEGNEQIGNKIGEIVTSGTTKASQVREMMQTLEKEGGPGAVDGMRRALAEWITRTKEAGGVSEAGEHFMKFAEFRKMVNNNRTRFEQVFTKEQMNTLDAIIKDMEIANRSLDRTKIPGRSNTAQDSKAYFDKFASEMAEKTWYIAMIQAYAGAEGGFFSKLGHAGLVGAGGVIFKLRQMGIKNISDLEREMLLNPEFAREALKKIPQGYKVQKNANLVRAARNSILMAPSAVEKDQQEKRQARASGGRTVSRALTADQVIAGLEKARKVHNSRTESILGKSDETVVGALNAASSQL
jgi:ddrB-like ParB superfamily domain